MIAVTSVSDVVTTMLGAHPESMAGRWKAAASSIRGIEYLHSIIGANAAGHVNFDAIPTTSTVVAA